MECGKQGHITTENVLMSSYECFVFLKVKEAAHNVDTQLVVVTCGSYRRGKSTCGDVDVLITHPDGESHKGVFSKVLHLLHQSGMLLS